MAEISASDFRPFICQDPITCVFSTNIILTLRSGNTKQYVAQDRLLDVNALHLNITKSCLFLDIAKGRAPQGFSVFWNSSHPTGSQLPKYCRIHSIRPSQPKEIKVIINLFLYFN